MELYKQRDFGELISAPFIWFGIQFKTLITGLFIFVGPFIIAELLLVNVFHFQPKETLYSNIQTLNFETLSGQVFILILIGFFKNVMVYTFVAAHIKVYVENDTEKVEINQIWTEMKRFFLPYAGGLFLGSLIIIFGIIMILFPGIYFAVALYPLFAIIIFEETGVTQSIGRSFNLIKGRWWPSFGLNIVMFFIFVFLTAIITLLLQTIVRFTVDISTGLVINNTISSLLEMITSVFFISTSVFLYGHLIAVKEQPDLADKISRINSNENSEPEDKEPEETETFSENNRFTDDDEADRFKPKY